MPGLTHGIDHDPAGMSATLARVRSLLISSRWGAALLLFLFLFILTAGIGIWRWQTSAARQTPVSTITPKATPVSSAPGNSTTLNVTQSTDNNGSSTSSASTNAATQGAQPHVSTQVQVNGQAVALPSDGNGTIHKEITTSDGNKSTVDITVNSSSSNSDSSSVDLNADSRQSSVNNSE